MTRSALDYETGNRCSQQAQRIEPRRAAKEKEILDVVHKGLMHSDGTYKIFLAKQGNAKRARLSCTRLQNRVIAARQRVKEALSSAIAHSRDETPRPAIDRTSTGRPGYTGPLDARYRNLDTKFSGRQADLEVRLREFNRADDLLEVVDRSVESLLNVIAEREKALEAERRRYLKNERERFRSQYDR